MKEIFKNIFGFMYTLSVGDLFFFIGTFLLIILSIYIIYLIKSSDDELPKKKSEFDIKKVTQNLESNYKPNPKNIKLTSYEEEQENNAIISYDELVKTRELNVVTYDDNYTNELNDIEVKKFDLEGTGSMKVIDPKIEVKLTLYEEEEEFLKVLKDLQSKLV